MSNTSDTGYISKLGQNMVDVSIIVHAQLILNPYHLVIWLL